MTKNKRSTTKPNQPSHRQLRVAKAIQHAISNIILHGGVYHPNLNSAILSFPSVHIGADLGRASIYVFSRDDEYVPIAVKILQELAPSIRKLLMKEVNLRRVPELAFYIDDSFKRQEKEAKVIDLLDKAVADSSTRETTSEIDESKDKNNE